MVSSWRSKAVSPADVVSRLSSAQQVFLHAGAATPHVLIKALTERKDLADVRLYHLHVTGDAPFAAPELEGRLRSVSFFTSAPLREPIAAGRADFIPIFLSDIPALFKTGQVPLDSALLHLSPPDQHGFCSLGTSVDTARAAADNAKILLAQINEQMPRTHGNSFIHIDNLAAFTVVNEPLSEHQEDPEGEVEAAIGQIVAELVEDGSTLQMGIGSIPNAVLSRLSSKRDLGVHTEMFSDGILPLIDAGVITNKQKTIMPGRTVTSFIVGSRKLYDFVHDNPSVEFHPCDRTNDPSLISKNDKVVAINSALQVDLSGQVCADSLGFKIYSGIGGQMDFLRGAALSRGGKPIIALPSTAAKGKVSRIALSITEGAGVVTTRGHVHWVVTEYGAVNLHGKSLRERADLLISIAHPDFRQELRREISEIRHF